MNTQPEALRLAEMLSKHSIPNGANLQAAKELRRLHSLNQELVEALNLAVRQNSHDMLMTGDELRTCETALAKAKQS